MFDIKLTSHQSATFWYVATFRSITNQHPSILDIDPLWNLLVPNWTVCSACHISLSRDPWPPTFSVALLRTSDTHRWSHIWELASLQGFLVSESFDMFWSPIWGFFCVWILLPVTSPSGPAPAPCEEDWTVECGRHVQVGCWRIHQKMSGYWTVALPGKRKLRLRSTSRLTMWIPVLSKSVLGRWLRFEKRFYNDSTPATHTQWTDAKLLVVKSAHQLWSHTTLLLKTTLLQSLLPLVSSGSFWTGMSNLLRQLRNMGFNLSNRLPALADLTCLSYTTLRCKRRNQGMRRPFQIKKSCEESVPRCCQCSEYPESSRQFSDVLPLELGHPTD